jgi:membrane protease YdiL (CAAX protease family)
MLAGFAIQTAPEELLFRGLVTQATVRLADSAMFAILVQSLLFAIMHIGNVAAFHGGWWAMVPYLITALSWGRIAWWTGSLLMSAGLHFASNTFNVFAVGVEGDVITAFGPFNSAIPSLTLTSGVVAAQAAASILLVELYLRWSRRSPVAAAA